jgi:hypothetical protein
VANRFDLETHKQKQQSKSQYYPRSDLFCKWESKWTEAPNVQGFFLLETKRTYKNCVY